MGPNDASALIFASLLGGGPLVLLGLLLIVILYRFILMNPNPFKAMQAVYVYLAAFVGLALIAVGLYGLVNHALDVLLTPASENLQNGIQFDRGMLVSPLTQIIVGLFVMIPHWAIGHHFHLAEGGLLGGSKRK